jgi:anti-sigma factor RsiW
MDVPADSKDDAIRKASQLPADFRLPDLKPWGLAFQGARFLMVDGQPATQLFYTTDNDKLGPVTLVVGNSPKPDLAPTFDRRDDVNLLYWRHHGHFYVVVGAASIGYLWNIHNDIAWQLDAI